MKLIDLHKEWCEKGELPFDGLCGSLPDEYREYLTLFDDNDLRGLSYWGCPELPYGHCERRTKYLETRQTIVLLICAMKGELK